jgi:hypothetical protein
MAIDHDKLQQFVGDLGATVAAGNVVIGHNLGLYTALAEAPATAAELACRTGTSPALSQDGGHALGAPAGETAIRQIATDAGFTRFRRAAETPFNNVYEIRP